MCLHFVNPRTTFNINLDDSGFEYLYFFREDRSICFCSILKRSGAIKVHAPENIHHVLRFRKKPFWLEPEVIGFSFTHPGANHVYESLENRVEMIAEDPYRWYVSDVLWIHRGAMRLEHLDHLRTYASEASKEALCARIDEVKGMLERKYSKTEVAVLDTPIRRTSIARKSSKPQVRCDTQISTPSSKLRTNNIIMQGWSYLQKGTGSGISRNVKHPIRNWLAVLPLLFTLLAFVSFLGTHGLSTIITFCSISWCFGIVSVFLFRIYPKTTDTFLKRIAHLFATPLVASVAIFISIWIGLGAWVILYPDFEV